MELSFEEKYNAIGKKNTLYEGLFVTANVFITAWYVSYPPRILSTLLEQSAECRNNIVLIKPVFDEIEPVLSPDRKLSRIKKEVKYPLGMWIEEVDFSIPNMSYEVNHISLGN